MIVNLSVGNRVLVWFYGSIFIKSDLFEISSD